MPTLPFLPFLLTMFMNLGGQQLGLPDKAARYLIMEIGSAKEGTRFEFTLMWLIRTGKQCELRQLECKAPYRLSVQDESCLVIYGKSGEGKIATQYSMNMGPKTSYQHLEKGEAIVVEFLPKMVGAGPTKWWTQGWGNGPRITMTVMSKDPTVY